MLSNAADPSINMSMTSDHGAHQNEIWSVSPRLLEMFLLFQAEPEIVFIMILKIMCDNRLAKSVVQIHATPMRAIAV